MLHVEQPYPEAIPIEDHALQKAFAICSTLRERYTSLEWYALLASSDRKTIDELILERNGANYSSYTSIPPQSIVRAAESAYDRGKAIVGWIHSHGSMGVFFSRTDDKNIDVVLNSVSLNNRSHTSSEEVLIENLALVNDSTIGKNSGIQVLVEGAKIREGTRVKIFEPVFTGWSYNIVINEYGEHHQEVAVIEESLLSKRTKKFRIDAPLKIIETQKQIDYEAIKQEVNQKIRRGGGFFGLEGYASIGIWGGYYRPQEMPEPIHEPFGRQYMPKGTYRSRTEYRQQKNILGKAYDSVEEIVKSLFSKSKTTSPAREESMLQDSLNLISLYGSITPELQERISDAHDKLCKHLYSVTGNDYNKRDTSIGSLMILKRYMGMDPAFKRFVYTLTREKEVAPEMLCVLLEEYIETLPKINRSHNENG